MAAGMSLIAIYSNWLPPGFRRGLQQRCTAAAAARCAAAPRLKRQQPLPSTDALLFCTATCLPQELSSHAEARRRQRRRAGG